MTPVIILLSCSVFSERYVEQETGATIISCCARSFLIIIFFEALGSPIISCNIHLLLLLLFYLLCSRRTSSALRCDTKGKKGWNKIINWMTTENTQSIYNIFEARCYLFQRSDVRCNACTLKSKFMAQSGLLVPQGWFCIPFLLLNWKRCPLNLNFQNNNFLLSVLLLPRRLYLYVQGEKDTFSPGRRPRPLHLCEAVV